MFSPFVNIFSKEVLREEKVFFLLRFGVLGCFVGHGLWGFVTKAGWLPFFDVYFVPHSVAYMLMPVIGLMDIITGVVCFFRPNRGILIWATFWTVFTAALRPSADMGMSEFFERAGNYGTPFAFLFLYGFPHSSHSLKQRLLPISEITEKKLKGFEFILRLSLFSLLAGHGSLALFKLSPLLFNHLNFLGLAVNLEQLQVIGLIEILLGFLVFFKPRALILIFFVLIWKLAWEMIFPFAGKPIDILETIERMGDYVIPALLFAVYQGWPKVKFSVFP